MMRAYPVKNDLRMIAIMLPCLIVGNALAKENVDFDKSVDFTSFHTFQLLPNPDGALAKANELMDGRVQDMIRQHLVAQGLKEVSANPDLLVYYDASTQEHKVYSTMGMGMDDATTTESTFTDGTLVINAYTPDPKKMVWRGTAEESVSDNPDKTAKNIEKSLDKLFEKWGKIKKKQYHD